MTDSSDIYSFDRKTNKTSKLTSGISFKSNPVLIQAERDGNTISSDRGIYMVDLNQKINKSDLLRRLVQNQDSEKVLYEKGVKIYDQINDIVTNRLANISIRKIYEYEKIMYDFHLDNTIRYSNSGIRDVQHAASFLYSKLVSYDAVYYKGTDAAAYYSSYGDIVGGIGSYPVLASPYYHQSSDILETINHQLLYETTKSNTAAIMLLASAPSRIKGLSIENSTKNEITFKWDKSTENNIIHYIVEYSFDMDKSYKINIVESPTFQIKLEKSLKRNNINIRVKAVNSSGMEGWDWARISTDIK